MSNKGFCRSEKFIAPLPFLAKAFFLGGFLASAMVIGACRGFWALRLGLAMRSIARPPHLFGVEAARCPARARGARTIFSFRVKTVRLECPAAPGQLPGAETRAPSSVGASRWGRLARATGGRKEQRGKDRVAIAPAISACSPRSGRLSDAKFRPSAAGGLRADRFCRIGDIWGWRRARDPAGRKE